MVQPFASALFHRDETKRKTIENRGSSKKSALKANTWYAVVSTQSEIDQSKFSKKNAAQHSAAVAMATRVYGEMSDLQPVPKGVLLGFIHITTELPESKLSEQQKQWSIGGKSLKKWGIDRAISVSPLAVPQPPQSAVRIASPSVRLIADALRNDSLCVFFDTQHPNLYS